MNVVSARPRRMSELKEEPTQIVPIPEGSSFFILSQGNRLDVFLPHICNQPVTCSAPQRECARTQARLFVTATPRLNSSAGTITSPSCLTIRVLLTAIKSKAPKIESKNIKRELTSPLVDLSDEFLQCIEPSFTLFLVCLALCRHPNCNYVHTNLLDFSPFLSSSHTDFVYSAIGWQIIAILVISF